MKLLKQLIQISEVIQTFYQRVNKDSKATRSNDVSPDSGFEVSVTELPQVRRMPLVRQQSVPYYCRFNQTGSLLSSATSSFDGKVHVIGFYCISWRNKKHWCMHQSYGPKKKQNVSLACFKCLHVRLRRDSLLKVGVNRRANSGKILRSSENNRRVPRRSICLKPHSYTYWLLKFLFHRMDRLVPSHNKPAP